MLRLVPLDPPRMLLQLMMVLMLIQHSYRHRSHHPLPSRLCRIGLRGSRRRCRSYNGALWGCEEMLTDQSLIRAGSLPGCCPTRDVLDIGPAMPAPQLHSS
ncbi:hypothetical protein Tco_0131666 [Tanacetum coccineum]